MLTSGELDTRIRIEQPVIASVGSTGHPNPTWTLVAELWAKRKPLGGRELFTAQQVTPSTQEEFWIRYRADLANPVFAAQCRLVHDGVNYDITYSGEIGRREGLRLLVKLPGQD